MLHKNKELSFYLARNFVEENTAKEIIEKVNALDNHEISILSIDQKFLIYYLGFLKEENFCFVYDSKEFKDFKKSINSILDKLKIKNKKNIFFQDHLTYHFELGVKFHTVFFVEINSIKEKNIEKFLGIQEKFKGKTFIIDLIQKNN